MAKPPVPMAPQLHDVTIVSTKKLARARVMGVPPEELGIERNARCISEANYAYHEIVTKTESDLISEGYDADQVKALETYGIPRGTEETRRDSVFETGGAVQETANRLVRLTENYIRMD